MSVSMDKPKKVKTDYKPYFRVLEDTFGVYWQFEYHFSATSRHRFDAALPCCYLAIEVEGGIHTKGRHTRGAGFAGDMLKYNLAAVDGWKILRFTPTQIKDLLDCREKRTTVFYDTLKSYFDQNPCPHQDLHKVLKAANI